MTYGQMRSLNEHPVLVCADHFSQWATARSGNPATDRNTWLPGYCWGCTEAAATPLTDERHT